MSRGLVAIVVAIAVAAITACGPRRVDPAGAVAPSTVVLIAGPDGSVGRAVVSS
jgi:hypothetical protein